MQPINQPTTSASSSPLDALAPYRDAIDEADRKLIAVLGDRLDAVRSIGALKTQKGASVLDSGREGRVAARWAALAEEAGINPHAARRVLAEVLQWSRREQERASSDSSAVTVAYQGAPGANGDLAARRLMGLRRTAVEPVGYRTFDATVAALASGEVDYALLPVENSIVGSIEAASALLLEGRFTIVDEESWDVRHALAVLPGTTIQSVRRVLSHPVALRQCRRTVVEALGLESVEVWDTAGAAQLVAAGLNGEEAAICPAEAAHEYGLEVLRHDVSDHPENWTRFLLLAREPEPGPPNVPYRTTLSFVADHRVGSLARCLAAFAAHGVNLTRLASYALAGAPGQYGFLVDLEGHIDNESVAQSLAAMRPSTSRVCVLGSYPNRTREPGPAPLALVRSDGEEAS